MKTNISHKSSERGNALLVALFLCLILSVTIAGYLKHAQQQNYLSVRAQNWNLSMTVTEAGVEEAMQHLNSNFANLETDGWTKNGTVYTTSRELNGSEEVRYTVSIDMVNVYAPIIQAQSFVRTTTLAANSDLTPTFAIGGVDVVPVKQTTISRAVKVTAGKNSLFMKAMVAKHKIDMNGNNIMTDSFNSSSPSNSINGMYPAGQTNMLLNNGDVASNDTAKDIINAGNGNIYGHVAVGPGGSVLLGPNGGVGTRDWVAGNPGGIQDGYFSDDMNFTFKSISLPDGYGSFSTPLGGTVTTTNYIYGITNATVTSSTYPSPVPVTGVTTNISSTTTSTKPSPLPYGLATNILTTATSSSTYPAVGTYVGTPTKKGSKWYYDKITGTNYTYPTYTYTYATASATTNYTIWTTNYGVDYVLKGSAAGQEPTKYYLGEIKNKSILVQGNALLVVGGNVSMSGQNFIKLDSTGQLEMYVGGTSCSIGGQGVFNPSGYAQYFTLYCTDSVTSLDVSGNGQFTGCIYAPCADVKLNGGGNAVEDFIGALVVNSVTMNGHYNFHYDEALKNYRGTGRYIVKQWAEIKVPAAQ